MAKPKVIFVRHANSPPVWACRWCGYIREQHTSGNEPFPVWAPRGGGSFHTDPKWHEYEMPTPEQVRARMRARGRLMPF